MITSILLGISTTCFLVALILQFWKRKPKMGNTGYKKYVNEFEKDGSAKKWKYHINKIDESHLPRISCELNCSRIAAEIKEIVPDWYGKDNEKTIAFYSIIADHIDNIVGEFAVSQYWNCVQRTDPNKMTKEEHMEWWLNHKVINK